MSIESPQMSVEKESPETKKSLELFRSKFMRALLLTGMLGAVEACGGVTEQDKAQMKLTPIESLTEHPESFIGERFVKVRGHIESGSTLDPRLVFGKLPNTRHVLTGPLSVRGMGAYVLRKESSFPHSSDWHQVDMFVDGGLEEKLKKTSSSHEFEVVGFLKYVQDKDENGNEKNVLMAVSIEDAGTQ